MAPVTPSPHRFLPGQRRQPSPSKEAKPNPATRQPQYVQPHETQRPDHASTSASVPQFSRTPRFAPGRPAQTYRAKSPPPRLAQALRGSGPRAEEVDETHDQDEDDEMLDNEPDGVLPTTEITRSVDNGENWSRELPYSPKCRRVDTLEDFESTIRTSLITPAKPIFKAPATPVPQLNQTTTPHFARGGSVALSEHATPRRPAFLRPAVAAAAETSAPLPEAFSPHRRGQKFVPGGLAATLQQWVIETGQSAVQSRRGQSYLRGEDYTVRVRLDMVQGSGPFTALGRQTDGAQVRLLLAGGNKDQGDSAEQKPSVGSVVGIRAPTWNVTVDGESWTVGVDWKCIS